MLSRLGVFEWLGYGALFAVVLVSFGIAWFAPGNGDAPELIGDLKRAAVVPTLLEPFATSPPDGSMLPLPPIPLVKSPENAASDNLLINGSFESGQSPWTVAGSTISGSPSELLAADGVNSFQILPPVGGAGSVFQMIHLKPRTFYVFSALIFNPGAAEAVLEVRDSVAATEVVGAAAAEDTDGWVKQDVTFVTGMATVDVSVGIRCSASAGSAVLLADQCSLYALPATDFFPENAISLEPDPEVAPTWYSNGKAATVVAEGYESGEALELQVHEGRRSSLMGLVPHQKPLVGRRVLLSAMVKCEFEGGALPEIRFGVKATGADGSPVEQNASFAGEPEWFETALLVNMPEGVSADAPPFDVVFVEAVGQARGRVLVDSVVMLGVPDGFSGGLALASRSE